MSKQRNRFRLLIVACCAVLASQTAYADYVLISAFGNYKIGQHLSDNAIVDIAKCDSIAVWNGKEFLDLDGPYKGPLSAYKAPKEQCHIMSSPEVIGERESIWDSFFRQVCEKKNTCDTVCKGAFERVSDKTKMKLKC
jgi:hypothetical protein